MFWVLQLGQGGRGDVTPQSRSTWHPVPPSATPPVNRQTSKQAKHQLPFAFKRKEKQYKRIGFKHQCLVVTTGQGLTSQPF